MATHSPHPSASGVVTLTSSTPLTVWVPNEVRNGDTSGSCTRRSSTSEIFTGAPSLRDDAPLSSSAQRAARAPLALQARSLVHHLRWRPNADCPLLAPAAPGRSRPA